MDMIGISVEMSILLGMVPIQAEEKNAVHQLQVVHPVYIRTLTGANNYCKVKCQVDKRKWYTCTIIIIIFSANYDHKDLTCNSEGTEPGSMLFPAEYNLGMCLSPAHWTHSVMLSDCGLDFQSWKLFKTSDTLWHLQLWQVHVSWTWPSWNEQQADE